MSLITHVNKQLTDTDLPRITRDPAIAAGTLLLFDFKSAFCNPNEDGDLVNGDTLNNLVRGAPGAVIDSGSAKLISERTTSGGIRAPGSSSLGQMINFGNSYNLHESNHAFIATAWIKIPSNGYTGNTNQRIFGRQGSASNTYMFNMDSGSDNLSPRVVANMQSSTPVHRAIPGFATDEVHQIGVAWTPGTEWMVFDGQLVSSRAHGNATLEDLSEYNIVALFTRQSTTLYRVMLEDVEVSGRTLAQAAAADYAAGSARGFS